MTVAKRFLVEGRVQGVFFRDWTVQLATGLRLRGWVRNRADGSVEILAAGDAGPLAELEEALGEGPPRARVDGVTVSDAEPPAEQGFVRRPTA